MLKYRQVHETLCPTNFVFYLAFEIYGNVGRKKKEGHNFIKYMTIVINQNFTFGKLYHDFSFTNELWKCMPISMSFQKI
jgi:hypothetical protein